MKKIFFFTLIICGSVLLSLNTVSAQTEEIASDSANESSDEAVQQNLKDRLKKVIEEKSDRIRGIMDGDQNRRGFIGVIKRISEEAVTLDTPRGTLVLTITPELQFWSGGKTIARTDIEIENEVVVIGIQDNDEFTPQRIYVSKETLRPPTRTIVVGTIESIERNSITVVSRTGEEKIFSINTQTKYTNPDGEAIKITDFEEEQNILLIALPETANQTVKDSSGRISLLRALGASQTGN